MYSRKAQTGMDIETVRISSHNIVLRLEDNADTLPIVYRYLQVSDSSLCTSISYPLLMPHSAVYIICGIRRGGVSMCPDIICKLLS